MTIPRGYLYLAATRVRRRLVDGGGLGGPVLPDTHPVRRHIAFSGTPSGVGMGKGDRRERFVHMPSRACRLNLRGEEVERGSYVKVFHIRALT